MALAACGAPRVRRTQTTLDYLTGPEGTITPQLTK